MLAIDSVLVLNNRLRLPQLGLGTWQIPNGQPVIQATAWALAAGYRHIDTARFYQNELGVGEAVKQSGLPREQIWVTTKLWPTDQLNAAKAFSGSLERLGLGYVDLYLVHWPVPGLTTRVWKQMEAIYAAGQCRAIGVSNYSTDQLKQVLAMAKVPPAVNQIHLSPFNSQPELVKFCQDHQIAVEAYSPLTHGQHLTHPAVQAVADKHRKSTAQVLIRWGLQQGFAVLPKSSHQGRIIENSQVYDFELSVQDFKQLDALS